MLWMRPALLSGFGLSFVLAKLENEAGYSDETPDFDRVSEGMEIYYYLFFLTRHNYSIFITVYGYCLTLIRISHRISCKLEIGKYIKFYYLLTV